MNFFEIPIFIISYNRLDDLIACVNRLEEDGYNNIHIIDNCSVNIELIDYLHKSRHHVHFLDKNWGHKVFWECGLFDDIINNSYYVVTDPDIIPVENCPKDYVQRF